MGRGLDRRHRELLALKIGNALSTPYQVVVMSEFDINEVVEGGEMCKDCQRRIGKKIGLLNDTKLG